MHHISKRPTRHILSTFFIQNISAQTILEIGVILNDMTLKSKWYSLTIPTQSQMYAP